MAMMIIAIVLMMLHSLWLTRRLFQVERLLSEHNKRTTILSEGVSLNRDKIMLNDIERKQEMTVEELLKAYKHYPWGSE